MSLLHELGMKHYTDKAYLHKYMDFYEKYFEPIRFEVKNLLEIGVWDGASIKVWLEYFPNAQIYGIDNDPKPSVELHDRFTFIKKDAFEPSLVDTFSNDFFDIVIDDGSHKMSEQRQSLKTYWSKVKPNGYFVMEDMHTSFWTHPFYADSTPTTYDFLVRNVDSQDGELNNIRPQFKETHLFHEPQTHFANPSLDVTDTHITMVIKK